MAQTKSPPQSDRMVLGITEEEFMAVSAAAEDANIRLEVVQGLPVWEFMPSPMHTIDSKRIDRSIRRDPSSDSDCGCHSLEDVSVRFPDGSLRRPDIAVFYRLPERTRTPTTLVPEAVIELVSPGSEVKDLQISPGFYLSQGVKDVIVSVPETGVVEHFRRDGRAMHRSPVDI